MKMKRMTKETSEESRREIQYKLRKMGREKDQKRENNVRKARQAREKILRKHENRITRYLEFSPDYTEDDFRAQF